MRPIQIPCVLSGYNRKADRSVSLRFNSTLEISSDDFAELDRVHFQTGWLLFSPNEFTPEDIPNEPASDGKKPSKRLRDVLFILWKQEGEGGDFETFYRARVNAIVEKIKGRLE